MPKRLASPAIFQLELLETRMLLAADIPWLGDAVVAVGTDISADLIPSKDNLGHDITVLLLYGNAAPDSSITIDTSHFGVEIDTIKVWNFEHVTIDGEAPLQLAVAWDVGELVVSAPILYRITVDNVESIEFKAPLPPSVSISVADGIGDAATDVVTLKAPSFGDTQIISQAKILTLVSGKATDSLNFWTQNFDQKVFLSFVPEKITLYISSTQLDQIPQMFQTGGIEGPTFEVPSDWIRVLPLDEYQAHVADMFGSNELPLPQGNEIPAALLTKPSTTVFAVAEHVALAASPEVIELPVVSEVVDLAHSVDSLPDFDVVADQASVAAPVTVSDFVLQLGAKEVAPIARVAPVVGPLAINMAGVVSPISSLLEPLRGLRDAIVQRFTQELVPGSRTALLVEPRPAKSAEEKKTTTD